MTTEREQVHTLVDLLPSDKLNAIRGLLEVIVDLDEKELTDEDRRAIEESREWFRKNPGGVFPSSRSLPTAA